MKNPGKEENSDLSESFKNLINALFPTEEGIVEDENDNRTDFSKDRTIVFAFDKVGDVIDACKAVKATYDHFSSLYFDESKKVYLLKMYTDGEPDANFRQNCISLLEYGSNVSGDKFFENYLAEHAKLLAEKDAVQRLG